MVLLLIGLILLALAIYLIWLEAIPVRKWFYGLQMKAIGAKTRVKIDAIDIIDKVEDWIDSL